MAGYDRRDQIGHYVTKEQAVYRPCTHACCRGYRAHPHNWPIIPAKRIYRTATDEQLARHYEKVAGIENDPQARGAELQIIAEFERRDRRALAAQEREREQQRRREARATNRAVQRTENEIERERIRVEAESVTRGYLVNAKGRKLGIDPEEILTGREEVFRRYASDEAKEYFAVHPRPTASYFRGRDTRVHDRATAPRRRARIR